MIEYIIKKQKITILFFVMIVMVGFLSFFQLPKQEEPDIVVNIATVTTVYPGATPEKVEQTVTKKIEERINELQDLKSISSTSSLGVSNIVVEVKDGVDPKQKWDELRKKVKDAEADLPADAKQPVIQDDLNRTFIQTFNIAADSREQLYSLRDMLKTWKDQLRTIPGVADVVIDGLPDQEVRVDIDTPRLQQYGITWGQVMNAVKTENEKMPIGDFDVNDRTYQLKLAESHNPDELNQVIVARTADGFPVYLKDVGHVTLTTVKPTLYAYHNGKPSVSLSITAEIGNDVPSLQRSVDAMMHSLDKSLPAWAKKESVYSQNERVAEACELYGFVPHPPPCRGRDNRQSVR